MIGKTRVKARKRAAEFISRSYEGRGDGL